MKNFKFLLVFLWLAVNSYADESRILVKAYTPNTIKFKLPNEYWDTEVKGKCNITVYTLKNTKMQFTLEPPNYETSFEYTPSDLGKTYLIWKGEEKDSGWFSTMKACPSSGYINLFVVGSREQIQQRWNKYFESVSSDKKSCIINALNLKNINIYSTNTNDQLIDPEDAFVTENLDNFCNKFNAIEKPSKNISCRVNSIPSTCYRIYISRLENNSIITVSDDKEAIGMLLNGKKIESMLLEDSAAKIKRLEEQAVKEAENKEIALKKEAEERAMTIKKEAQEAERIKRQSSSLFGERKNFPSPLDKAATEVELIAACSSAATLYARSPETTNKDALARVQWWGSCLDANMANEQNFLNFRKKWLNILKSERDSSITFLVDRCATDYRTQDYTYDRYGNMNKKCLRINFH